MTSLFSNAELLAANNGQQNNPSLIRSRIFGADSRYRAELMRSRFGKATFFIFDAYAPITNGPLKGLPDCVFQTEDEQALLAKMGALTPGTGRRLPDDLPRCQQGRNRTAHTVLAGGNWQAC